MSDRYHSLHVAPPQAGYESLAWWPAAPRADRIRIREHTCDCRTLSYELCQGGGLMFVRRTYRSDGVLVQESAWMPAAQAEQLWGRLLRGEAR